MSGRNHYVEGTGGRKLDYASKSFDLTVSSGATKVASVLSAHASSSFELEVSVVGRNAGGNCYVKATRYVRPESGAQVYSTIGTDTVLGTVSVAFVNNGSSGTDINVTAATNDAYVTVHVQAKAGGGTATSQCGVTVVMA